MDTPPNDDSSDEMKDSALLSSVTPPRGTDVLAVQTEADPAPIVLGTVTPHRTDGDKVDSSSTSDVRGLS